MYLLFGILSGATIVVARMCNAELGNRIGNYKSTFYNYTTGLLGAILLLYATGGALFPFSFREGSIIMYLGGLIGVCNMIVSNYITPKMSAYVLTLLIFISQLASGLVIDALTGMPVSIGKIAGGILVLLGLLYNQRLDKKDAQPAAATDAAYTSKQ